MQIKPVHERLRLARLERGESLAEVAKRAGVREALLQTIEAGDFDRLPSGIYGRAAVRSFAEALGLDGKGVLAECASQFVPLEDQVTTLARIRRVSPIVPSLADQISSFPHLLSHQFARVHSSDARRIWRLIGAAILDCGVVLAMLLALVGSTVLMFGRSVLSSGSGPSFAIMAVLLATGYFTVFGGIGGQTVGARVAGLKAQEPHRRVDLAGVAVRTLQCAARDAQAIEQLAGWAVSFTGYGKCSESRRDTPRVEQPAGS